MKSTMFLNEITCIDHAWITSCDDGEVTGMSYNLSVEVTGEIDEQEQVVIDFSGCKKQIKHLVDESPYAIDHKLVAVKGFSNYKLHNSNSITSPRFSVTSSVTDWVIEIDGAEKGASYHEHLTAYLERMLLEQLSKDYPLTEIKVHLSNTPQLPAFVNKKSVAMFHYVHGLKFSTSYGCQNIAHGHRSFIATDAPCSPANTSLVNKLQQDLGSVVFIHKENVSSPVGIDYTSQRGAFHMTTTQDRITLPTETTVENLAEFIAAKYRDDFVKVGATRVWVSEGLAKGAVVDL